MKCLLAVFIIFGLSLADNAEEFIKSSNLLFTPAVYKQVLEKKEGNFLMSPFSAEVAIYFAEKGCKGATAAEILRALYLLPHDKEKVDSAMKTVLPALKSSGPYALHLADKMYVKENFTINDTFKKVATEIFQADSENIDFTKTKEAADTINKWVENNTESKIHDLISPDDLDNSTRLILVNAIYFKGDWISPFKLQNTRKANFYESADKAVEVDMMHHRQGYFRYYESPHLKAKFVVIPFQGRDAYMVFVLPNEKYGLADLEQKIEEVFLPQNLTRTYVRIAIPKFKIESELDFKKILEKLGVHKAFNDKEADLSGIYGNPGDLVIDKIKQKSFIDVSEVGVEAAAATFVRIGAPKSSRTRRPYKEFIADHPFIFFVRVKGLILFAGRVTSPGH